jgi:translocation and assembly module TamB
VRILYQDQIRVLLDSNLNLSGNTQASNLTGRVLVNRLSFTPNFDLTSLAQLEFGPESMPSPGFTQNLKLNITVQTSNQLNVMSNQVSLQGGANLQVIGTAQNPVITGRTDFTSGDIFLMGQRYQIQRGVVQFSNPNRTEPVVNVVLTTTIDQYNLTLTFTGPLDKIQTSYISSPPLSTADIVNLIARGQTPEQAANSPNLSATSLLAKGAASEVSGGIQKLAGLSSFSIDPTLGGSVTNPGARIALQKRVTANLLMTFAFDVTDTQNEVIQGEYRFNKRWSASVTRNENGSIAVDGRYHTRF